MISRPKANITVAFRRKTRNRKLPWKQWMWCLSTFFWEHNYRQRFRDKEVTKPNCDSSSYQLISRETQIMRKAHYFLVSREATLVSRDVNLVSRDVILVSREVTLVSRDAILVAREVILVSRDVILVSRDENRVSRAGGNLPLSGTVTQTDNLCICKMQRIR